MDDKIHKYMEFYGIHIDGIYFQVKVVYEDDGTLGEVGIPDGTHIVTAEDIEKKYHEPLRKLRAIRAVESRLGHPRVGVVPMFKEEEADVR